jgi:hypothetical protein
VSDSPLSLLDAALQYEATGLSIVPVKFVNGAKQGAIRWKQYQAQRPAPDTLRKWFSAGKYRGLAVVLGAVSGNLACRDFDDAGAYQAWAANHPDLAERLPTVQTGRGFHVYFICEDAKTLHLGDGELRGAKSLCVLPPSIHPATGKPYRWTVPLPDGPLPTIDPAKTGLAEVPVQQMRTDEKQKQSEQFQARSWESGRKAIAWTDELETAVQATLPASIQKKRNRAIFELGRRLRGIPALADVDPRDLRPFVKRWHALALPTIATKPFEETWADFLYSWPRVEIPFRVNLLEDALSAARANALPGLDYDQTELRDLAGLCRELQTIMGDKPFFLSVRTAGRLLNVDPTTAWRWLFVLEQDGLIATIEKGNAATGRASRFRYVGGADEQVTQGEIPKGT